MKDYDLFSAKVRTSAIHDNIVGCYF